MTGCARTGCPKLVDKLLQAFTRLATSLMNSRALLQVVPTTCYRAASQQLVNKLCVTNLVQLDKITALLQTCWQACYKLVASTTCWQVMRFCMCSFRDIIIYTKKHISVFFTILKSHFQFKEHFSIFCIHFVEQIALNQMHLVSGPYLQSALIVFEIWLYTGCPKRYGLSNSN